MSCSGIASVQQVLKSNLNSEAVMKLVQIQACLDMYIAAASSVAVFPVSFTPPSKLVGGLQTCTGCPCMVQVDLFWHAWLL